MRRGYSPAVPAEERAGPGVSGPAAAGGQPVDPILVEDGELTLGLDRDHPSLHDAPLAEDAAFGDLGHPALEHGFFAGERGTHVAQGQRDGRSDRPHDRIGRGEDDVEGGGQHRSVHAAGCSFVGDVEDPPAERLGRLEVEDERQRHRVERPDHDVIGHGAAQRHVLRRTVLVGRNEPGQRFCRHVGLELVGERGQAGGQAGGLGGGRSSADRQPDEAAQDVGQLAGFGLAVAEPGMILERRRAWGRASTRREEYCRLSPTTFGRRRPMPRRAHLRS